MQEYREKQPEEVIDFSEKFIRLAIVNGGIFVMGRNEPKITLVWEKVVQANSQEEADQKFAKLKLVHEFTESQWFCRENSDEVHSGSIQVSLFVPKSLKKLAAMTVNGGIAIQSLETAAHVESQNGAIIVSEVRGQIFATGQNGSVTIMSATGQIEAKTANGSVHIQDTQATVNASSVNGSVSFQGTLKEGRNQLRTSIGSVSVQLQNQEPFDLSANTAAWVGSITNRFPFTTVTRDSKTQLQGRYGQDPNVFIELETNVGKIRIE